jgi:hypothetical protein
VVIDDPGSNQNTVAGNLIGTDASGTKPLANGYGGIFIGNGAQENLVGTNGDGVGDTLERNIISANTFAGVQLNGPGTNANAVAGNFIGTDGTGTQPLGNLDQGVFINGGAQSNRIGTTGTDPDAAAEGNVISANGFTSPTSFFDGVEIQDPGTNLNTVAGNRIGTDVSGTLPLGNADPGIGIHNGAQGNQVGGGSAVLGNLIAYNEVGVVVYDDGTIGNSIRANSIFSNGQPGGDSLGIDLNWDGVTMNDNLDGDAGPNNQQNYPVILSAAPGSSTTASGYLNSMPSTTFTLDFYASAAPDPSNFGPGQRYLGSAKVTTDASGNANFSATVGAASAGEWLTATATDPGGDTSEFSAARQLAAAPPPINPLSWTPIGPTAISDYNFQGPIVSGRVAVAAPDPTNANAMYLASDDGGVWKTSDWLDPSPVWTPLTDSQSSLSFGAYQSLVVYPGNPSILYAAVQGPGGGILKSTNGGTTWTLLDNADFNNASFGSLAVSPTNSNVLYLAVWFGPAAGGGVYKSTNGGTTWTNTTASIHPGAATDLVMDPANPAILYAGLTQDPNNGATNGLYVTTNGGTSWTQLTNGILSGNAVGTSIRLAISPSAPQNVYATVFNATLANNNFPYGVPQRFASSNGGTSWTQMAALPGNDEYRYWHMVLSVDPHNSQIVYTNGDHTLYQSTDGGATWTLLYSEDPVGGYFDDSGALIMTGDRGLYRWTGGSAPFVNKQGNLQNAELYTLTMDPTNPNIAYGISQDQFDGLKFFGGSTVWNDLGGAQEAGKILVDPTNPNRVYAYEPIGNNGTSGGDPTTTVIHLLYVSNDGGATFTPDDTGIDPSLAGYNLAYTAQKAFVMDPSNHDRLLVGTNVVYETTNDGASWTAISPQLSPGQFLTGLAVAPSAPNTIYAATADGKVFLTTNDGATWQEMDSGLPRDFADDIVSFQINPTNPNQVFASPGTFPTNVSGSNHVFMTTSGGTSWTDITGNLPANNFTNAIVADWRFATPVLYVGTARGVYRSLNLGGSWARFGTALPNSPVTDLQFLPQFDLLAAATYGRGVFEIQAAGPATHYTVTAPASAVAGKAFSITVTAYDSLNVRVTAYTGTVHFTSTDPLATLPANYTFSVTDLGQHSFAGVILRKAGSRTITATDTVTSSVTGKATVLVSASTATHFTLVASTTTPTAGVPFSVTVTALDAFGNVATGYRGTVHFTSSDTMAVLPADYTFTSVDKGKHTFSVTLNTTGSQTVTATDKTNGTIKGTVTVTVQPHGSTLIAGAGDMADLAGLSPALLDEVFGDDWLGEPWPHGRKAAARVW